jgi:hypothetical protein
LPPFAGAIAAAGHVLGRDKTRTILGDHIVRAVFDVWIERAAYPQARRRAEPAQNADRAV